MKERDFKTPSEILAEAEQYLDLQARENPLVHASYKASEYANLTEAEGWMMLAYHLCQQNEELKTNIKRVMDTQVPRIIIVDKKGIHEQS